MVSSTIKGIIKTAKLTTASLKIKKLAQITNKLVITSKSSKVLKQYEALSNQYRLPKTGKVDDYLRSLNSLLKKKGSRKSMNSAQRKELETFRDLLTQSKNKGLLKGLSVSDLFKPKNFKYLMLGIVPTTTGAIASLYTDENLQYVEYLTQEEYFRKCGFNPYLNK